MEMILMHYNDYPKRISVEHECIGKILSALALKKVDNSLFLRM